MSVGKSNYKLGGEVNMNIEIDTHDIRLVFDIMGESKSIASIVGKTIDIPGNAKITLKEPPIERRALDIPTTLEFVLNYAPGIVATGLIAKWFWQIVKGKVDKMRIGGTEAKLSEEGIEKRIKEKMEEGRSIRGYGKIKFSVQRIGLNPSGIAILSCKRASRGFFPDPDQDFTLVIDNRQYSTSIRNLSSGCTSIAKTFEHGVRITRYELCLGHKLKEGDKIFIEVEVPFRKYRLLRSD